MPAFSNKIYFFLLACFILSCHSENNVQPASIHFTSLPSQQTGVAFNNIIIESDSLNLLMNEYAYMGSGVGIGDFNNDGLPDIFFAASQASCRLYINKGNMQFEDMTEKAGLLTNSWCTGISIVDINNDGYDDIYVCVSGNKNPNKRKNLLYINNGLSPSPSGESLSRQVAGLLHSK